MCIRDSLISNLAAEEDLLTYVSVWDPMLTNEGKADPTLFVEDGLHINAKGYEVWTKLVRSAIENL